MSTCLVNKFQICHKRKRGFKMIKQPSIEKSQNNLSFQDQSINIDKLNSVMGDTELTPEEERILIWLSGLETSTIDTIISVMKKVSWPNSHTDHMTYSDLSILCKNKVTLKQARLASGLTQAELAEKSGIKKSSISNYEQGRITLDNIAFGTVKKFVEVLDVPLESLTENDA